MSTPERRRRTGTRQRSRLPRRRRRRPGEARLRLPRRVVHQREIAFVRQDDCNCERQHGSLDDRAPSLAAQPPPKMGRSHKRRRHPVLRIETRHRSPGHGRNSVARERANHRVERQWTSDPRYTTMKRALAGGTELEGVLPSVALERRRKRSLKEP